MKKSLIVIFALLLVAAPQSHASAHATPVSYEPALAASVASSPARIRITFSERLEPAASGFVLLQKNSERVVGVISKVESGDGRTLSASLPVLANGAYLVSWHVGSKDDGHFTNGAYPLFVGVESTPVAAGSTRETVQYSSSFAEALTLWIELLGQAILIGLFVLLLSRTFRDVASQQSIRKKIVRMVRFSCIAIIVGSLLYISGKSYSLAIETGGSFVESIIAFGSTVAGLGALVRALAAVLFAASFYFAEEGVIAGNLLDLMIPFFLLLGMTLSRAYISHAAASHFYPIFSVFVNWIHLIFKDLWVGCALVLALLTPYLADREFAKILLVFARMAIVSLLVGGVSGTYIIWLHLKSFQNLGTDWGLCFIALSGAALVLFALRMYSQFGVRTASRAKRFLRLEALAGLVVLLVTSLIIITTPPLPVPTTFAQEVLTNGVRLVLTQDVSDGKVMILEVHSAQQSVVEPIVLVRNEKETEDISVGLTHISGSRFSFLRDLFSRDGVWSVHVDLPQQNALDALADFRVAVPSDLDGTGSASFGKDLFTATLVASALMLIVLARLLYRHLRTLGDLS